MTLYCPECHSTDLRFFEAKQRYNCNHCGYAFELTKHEVGKLRIFLSYGHDANEELVRMIKTDLSKRGHDVWFDRKDIKFGDDWRHEITDGILNSQKFLSFLSKHSTREPGVCLQEIAIALGAKGGTISTILVEKETEVQAPPSISHIQWLDMHDWKVQLAKDETSWNEWYQEKLDEIIRVVESEESRQFAGEIEKLSKYLKPISSDSRVAQLLSKGFVGREWMWDEVEEWRTNPDRSSRLFWIMGGPGVGKSAFAANFTHFGKNIIIAAQFCEWNKPDHRNPARVFRSIAFQLATRVPDYRKLLLTLPEISQLDGKNAAEIFEYLFVDPLQKTIQGGRERYLILIDALDEAAEGERNALVETLARHAPELPEWLGMLVTSRPESSVTSPLQGLKPYVLDTTTEENKSDIRLYLHRQLKDLLNNRSDAEYLIEHILEKSEGVFLYIERVCDDLNRAYLSLDNLAQFPIGLGGIFKQFFDRQFPDLEYFRSNIRPALRCILAAPEPLPLDILQKLFTWQEEEMYDFIRILGSLFPLMLETGRKVIKPYHKSLIDWLTNQSASDHYYVNTLEGHGLLADYGWQQHNGKPEILDIYFIKWLPSHLQTLERWDDLVSILCNLDFIQSKASAKLAFDLVKDFNDALEVIPDNAENIRQENEHQARIDKYVNDLILYAKGEITELDIPQSITPWPEEKIDAEIERIKTSPTKADLLKDFLIFLGHESSNLQNFAYEFTHFTHQQAWNYTAEGPVGKAADELTPPASKFLLRRSPTTRPQWNPLPMALRTLKGHTRPVSAVSISPDGKHAISGSGDHTCILWNLSSGEAIKTIKGHTSFVYALSMTPDGKYAISSSYDKTCILWDLSSGEAIKTLKGHTHFVEAVSISPDGKHAISGSGDHTCILWDLSSGEAIKTLKGHTEQVKSVSITPDGKHAISGSGDHTCILWDLTSGEAIKLLKGHTEQVKSVSITPDGKHALSGSQDRTCILWDLSSGEAIKILEGHKAYVTVVSISPDGKHAISGSGDKTCILWDLSSGEAIKILKGHARPVSAVSITPDGKYAISGSQDTTCIVWDLISSEAIKPLKGHTRPVSAVSISPDGKQAISSAYDKKCILWDLRRGDPIKLLKGHIEQVKSVSITPDGKHALAGSQDNSCILWDLSSSEAIKTLKGHTSYINAVSISPDRKHAISGSDDTTCILWDLISGEAIKTLKGHTHLVSALSITPDGKHAVSGSDDTTCILWDLSSGEAIKILKGHTEQVKSVSISPDGTHAISGSGDNTCILWDLISGEAIKILKGHTSLVYALSISPDGKHAVSGSDDKTCILWDLTTGKKLARFLTNSPIRALALYSESIVLGSFSGEVVILNAKKEMLCTGLPITTIRQIWDFELQHYRSPSTDCPLCGLRFAPPASLIVTIDTISKKAGLKPEQSPCLELPDEAREDPGLLGNCPKCGGKLKFNPFVAGGGNGTEAVFDPI